jgi:hypothetical protein
MARLENGDYSSDGYDIKKNGYRYIDKNGESGVFLQDWLTPSKCRPAIIIDDSASRRSVKAWYVFSDCSPRSFKRDLSTCIINKHDRQLHGFPRLECVIIPRQFIIDIYSQYDDNAIFQAYAEEVVNNTRII